MVVEHLESQVRALLPAGARPGARVHASAVSAGQEVAVICRVDRKGKPVLDYFCAGARMTRKTLLMQLCTEAACPQVQAVQVRWRAFNGRPDRVPPRRFLPLRVLPLMEEVAVDAVGHRCVARPASFECLMPCPMGAHAPDVLRKPGWDLFEDGVWIAGGLRTDPSTGAPAPRFGSVDDARRWMAAQQVQAQRLLEAVRG